MFNRYPCRNGTIKFFISVLTIITVACVVTSLLLQGLQEAQARTDSSGVFEIIVEKDAPKTGISLSKSEFEQLAYTVEQEAHDLSIEHKSLIAKVILNRVHHEKFPDTVHGVLSQKGQFQGYINYKTKKHKPTPETIFACKKAMRDKKSNVMFFYNKNIAHPKHQKFFEHNKKLQYVKTIEGHRFFKMIES
jgi:spore germination cell wall hydrolase CwlJ-like protein